MLYAERYQKQQVYLAESQTFIPTSNSQVQCENPLIEKLVFTKQILESTTVQGRLPTESLNNVDCRLVTRSGNPNIFDKAIHRQPVSEKPSFSERLVWVTGGH
ncbi:MAG: hypothetical protein KJP16_15715 [Gammaproteobacteria bacterium]|nr:hypothetical protein [Gammaproteobacteria bacterium]NNL52252.1 hypothetical protein [Woeseiaceae bacterium]